MQPAKGSGRSSPKIKSPARRRAHHSDEYTVTHRGGNFKAGHMIAEPKGSNDRGIGLESAFDDHISLGQRMAKSLYFSNRIPSTPRPSLPLTVLAVKSFTTEVLGNTDTLEFLDLELASQIGRNACVSPTALIMALVYLERLSNNNPNYLSTVKPSELFVISLLVASKFIQDDGEDSGIYNDEWAASSKIDLQQINRLELQFLDAITWNVNVNLEEFETALATVERKLALNQGLRRGWFTYTEIRALAKISFGWHIMGPLLHDYVFKVVTAACAAYAALLAALIGSSFLGPQIYALTKTILISTSIFQDPLIVRQNQNSAFCTSLSANVSFQEIATARYSSAAAVIRTSADAATSADAFNNVDLNDSDIMELLNWNSFDDEKVVSEQLENWAEILMNPFGRLRNAEEYAKPEKSLPNLYEVADSKKLLFETLKTLPGEEIS